MFATAHTHTHIIYTPIHAYRGKETEYMTVRVDNTRHPLLMIVYNSTSHNISDCFIGVFKLPTCKCTHYYFGNQEMKYKTHVMVLV